MADRGVFPEVEELLQGEVAEEVPQTVAVVVVFQAFQVKEVEEGDLFQVEVVEVEVEVGMAQHLAMEVVEEGLEFLMNHVPEIYNKPMVI